jgi:Zn-dependent oligopeptidase
LFTATHPLAFYQHVSPNKALRDASNEAEALTQAYHVEMCMRQDIFATVQDAAAAAAAEALGAEEKRLVEKEVLEGKRNGLALPAPAREKLTALWTELSAVQLAFGKNMSEEDGHVALSAAELAGVPPDVVAGYQKRTMVDDTELYEIPFKTTDIFPILKHATDPAAREKTWDAYESRLAVNTSLLARAVTIRRDIAGLLGYATWADYRTEMKMVKTGKGVADVRCTALPRRMTR